MRKRAYTEVSTVEPPRRETEGVWVVVTVTLGGMAMGALPILESVGEVVEKVRTVLGAGANARRRVLENMVGGVGVGERALDYGNLVLRSKAWR